MGESSQEPLVSVLMPIWRAEKYIAQTLESLRNQRYANWELLAVADGGDTGSSEIIAAFAKANPRQRVYYEVLDRHAGAAEVRATAARQAKGSLFAFLDADDLWLPGFLDEAVKRISGECQFVASPLFLIDSDNNLIGTYGPLEPEVDEPLLGLFYRNFIAPAGAVMTREAFEKTGGFPSQWKIVADWALWTACRRLNFRLAILPLPESVYRKHRTSLTSKQFNVQNEGIRFLSGVLRTEDPAVVSEANRRVFAFARQSWVLHWGTIRFMWSQFVAFPWRVWLLPALVLLFSTFCLRMATEKIRKTPNAFGPAYPVTKELLVTLAAPPGSS